jgi:hypothetical protein
VAALEAEFICLQTRLQETAGFYDGNIGKVESARIQVQTAVMIILMIPQTLKALCLLRRDANESYNVENISFLY